MARTQNIYNFGSSNPFGFGSVSTVATKRKKRKTARKVSRRKKRNSYMPKKRIRRTPYTAGKRKDRSMKRIRYTKRGQPYVIMASGKARFIKKKSAKTSRKRKGGKY